MIYCKDLTEEEREFIYKCSCRLHKENGTFNQFKSSTKYCKNGFLKKGATAYTSVRNYLVNAIWSVLQMSPSGDAAGFTNSILFMGIVDKLLERPTTHIKTIINEIVKGEFCFINSELYDNYAETMKPKLKKTINAAYKKYNAYIDSDEYHNLPIS